MISHPPHYNHGKYEHAEVAIAWKLGGLLYNATKYICRAGHKGDASDDLRKAIWYLEREIKLLKTGEEFGLAKQCTVPGYIPNLVAQDWSLSPNLTLALKQIYSCESIRGVGRLETAVNLIKARIDLLTP